MRPHLYLLLSILICLSPACSLAAGEGSDASAGGLSAARKQSVERGLLGPVGWGKATIQQRMEELKVPAVAVAVVDGGQLDWADGFGAGVSDRTLFQAASISKTVTALTALRMTAAGKLDLDAPAGMPGVTLARLLNHTAGTNVPGFPGYAPNAPVPTADQVLAGQPPSATARVECVREPGSEYAYSGGGTLLAQKAMERAGGVPFADLAREYVLGPLGMASSDFAQPLPAEYVPRAAKGHDLNGRELPGGFRVYPELAAAGLWTSVADLARLLIAVNRLCLGPAVGEDAGSLASTGAASSGGSPGSDASFLPRDLGRRMVKDAALAECMKSGLGVFIVEAGGEIYLVHWGANAGYRGVFVCRPSRGQGVAVLAAGDNGEALIAEVVRAVAALQRWPGFEPASFTPRKLSKSSLANLCGKYAGKSATVEVLAGDGVALIKTRPDVAPLPMYTENGVEFWYAEQLGAARVIFDDDELVLANCPSRAERFKRIH